MKKAIAALFALMLVLTLSAPALAETMYVYKNCKAYEEPDTHSRVTIKLHVGHDLQVGDYENGFYETKYGWVQEKYLTYEITPDICSHKWGKWYVVEEATCTSRGLKQRECSICGDVEQSHISKTGHSYGKWKVTKSATCTRQGTRTRTCRNCGQTETERFYADHEFGAWTVVRAATCSVPGQRIHTCVNCGTQETKAIETLPHTFAYQIIQEATDHSAGMRAQVCQVCGYTEKAVSYDPEGTIRRGERGEHVYRLQQLLVEQGYLNVGGADGIFGGGTEKALVKFQADQGLNTDGIAWPQTQKRLAHDFGPWETVKALTRTEPGERRRVCKDCGYVQTETVEAGNVVERGSRGENVRALQQILSVLGYNTGSFDGIYGQKLDNAFAAFDADHGMTFQQGRVRPADVDALLSAWVAQDPVGMKVSNAMSPVNLALTVNPAADAVTDSDVTTYTWSLTNMGAQKCMFNALLLTYGKGANFGEDNLVMVLDGQELKANVGNSASGSFTVARDWGDGNLNFAAMAVDESTGFKWLSNTVTFSAAGTAEPRCVAPLPVELNVYNLPDGEYAAAFDRGDVAGLASGIFMNAVHIYSMDTYDASEIEGMAEGDTVVVEGQEIPVKTMEIWDDLVVVNGGIDAEDGCAFTKTEDGDAYRVNLDDDLATYTELGVTSLPVDPAATYYDDWDIESDPVTTDYDGILSAIQTSENDSFNRYNTTLTLQNGRVIELRRVYMP